MNKTVSGSYTLAYLYRHPKTKDIVYKYLNPTVQGGRPQNVQGTLRDMAERNMGGGIPYENITALMKELDALPMPLAEMTLEQEVEGNIWALTKEDWSTLEEIYTNVCNHKGLFSERVGDKVGPDGTIEIGFVKTSSIVDRTMGFLHMHGLIVEFDWVKWNEGRELLKSTDDVRFEKVSLVDVIKLFSAIERNDRFNEGALANLFESGDAKLLLKRLLEFKP